MSAFPVKSSEQEKIRVKKGNTEENTNDKKSQRTIRVNLGRVGVDIIGLDHALGSQNFGTLVISKRRLAAHINHGLHAIRITHKARRRVVLF